jgi:hypothetical protein
MSIIFEEPWTNGQYGGVKNEYIEGDGGQSEFIQSPKSRVLVCRVKEENDPTIQADA